MLSFRPVLIDSLLLVYYILVLWWWKVRRSSHFWHTSLDPPSATWPFIPNTPLPAVPWYHILHLTWNGENRPIPSMSKQCLFLSRWTNVFVSLSLSSLFVWRIRTKIVDFMCRHRDPFFQHTEQNLGEDLWENTLQLRSWGSDVKVSAAATLLQTTIVIYTACTERWLSYKPRIPVPGANLSEEKIYLRNLCQHFERLIRVILFLTEVCSRLLDQQPAKIAGSFFFFSNQ